MRAPRSGVQPRPGRATATRSESPGAAISLDLARQLIRAARSARRRAAQTRRCSSQRRHSALKPRPPQTARHPAAARGGPAARCWQLRCTVSGGDAARTGSRALARLIHEGRGKRPGENTDDDDAGRRRSPSLTHLLKWVRGAIPCPLAPRYHAVSRHEPPPETSHPRSRYSYAPRHSHAARYTLAPRYRYPAG
jgi:hypothetical protein